MISAIFLLAALPGPALAAEAPSFTLIDQDVTLVEASAERIRFRTISNGFLRDGSAEIEVRQRSLCEVDLTAEQVVCATQFLVDGEEASARLDIGSDLVPIWQVSADMPLSDEAAAVAVQGSTSAVSGAIHGWTWTDTGGLGPRMVVEWILRELLASGDVLIYIDGACINCWP